MDIKFCYCQIKQGYQHQNNYEGSTSKVKNYLTIEDVIPELHEAKYLTITDMKCRYWQVILDKESSLLTTFNKPYGRFCFTTMLFGLNVMGDAFQRKLD